MPLFSDMPIAQRFGINVLIALIAIFTLCCGLLIYQWLSYREAGQALLNFQSYQAASFALEKISLERAMTTSVLGEDLPIPDARMAALQHARQENDLKIAQFLDTLPPERCAACASSPEAIQRFKINLSATREEIDQFIQLPRVQREEDELNKIANHLYNLTDEFLSIVVDRMTSVIANDSNMMSYMIFSRLSTNLREQAGRLGLHFINVLAKHRQFTEKEHLAIEQTRGRVTQLHSMMEEMIINHPGVLSTHFARMDEQYFKEGLRYIDTLRALASQPGGADISITEVVQRYMPLLRSITDFRDSTLLLAESKLRQHQSTALLAFVCTGVIEALLLTMLVWMMAKFRQHVLNPFVQATRVIHALAEGDFAADVPASFRLAEIKGMFSAIHVLKLNSVERTRLELERGRLMEELRTLAETDPLTRLLNRRAFEQRTRALCKETDATKTHIALVIFDLDYFKKTNDTYGHAVGDEALRIIAKLCRENWRQSDVVARIGGEEFAVMMRVDTIADAQLMADRMRQRIADAVVPTGSEVNCTMTASFGLAVTADIETTTIEQLFRRADRMLYEAKAAGRNRIAIDAAMPLSA